MTIGHSEQEGETIRSRIKRAFASTAAKRRTRWRLASACIATPMSCWGYEGTGRDRENPRLVARNISCAYLRLAVEATGTALPSMPPSGDTQNIRRASLRAGRLRAGQALHHENAAVVRKADTSCFWNPIWVRCTPGSGLWHR